MAIPIQELQQNQSQQKESLERIINNKTKFTRDDIRDLTKCLLQQGTRSDQLRQNLDNVFKANEDPSPVEIILALCTAIKNHNANAETKDRATMLLIKSDYNGDPKNGTNVDKQVFITEIQTIVNNHNILKANETIKKEEAQQKARVDNNQNATKAGSAAAIKAREIAELTRKEDPLIIARATPGPQTIVTDKKTTKQEAEKARKAEAKAKREAEAKQKAEAKAKQEARRQKAEEAAKAKAEAEAKARQKAAEARRQKEEEDRRQKAEAEKAKREAEARQKAKAKAEEARRQKEEAKAEEINPFEIFTENPIFSFLSALLSPSSKQNKKEESKSPLLPKSSRQEEIKPPHPDDIEVPSLSQVLEERKTAKEQNPAKKRFTDQREAEINAANNPMTFIKKGLKGLYNGIIYLFSAEKEEERKPSNSPAAQCRRDPHNKDQGLQGLKNTLRNTAGGTGRNNGHAERHERAPQRVAGRRAVRHTNRARGREAPRQIIR